MLADDQLINQQSMLYKLQEINQDHRLEIFQNGEEVLVRINEILKETKRQINCEEITESIV